MFNLLFDTLDVTIVTFFRLDYLFVIIWAESDKERDEICWL